MLFASNGALTVGGGRCLAQLPSPNVREDEVNVNYCQLRQILTNHWGAWRWQLGVEPRWLGTSCEHLLETILDVAFASCYYNNIPQQVLLDHRWLLLVLHQYEHKGNKFVHTFTSDTDVVAMAHILRVRVADWIPVCARIPSTGIGFGASFCLLSILFVPSLGCDFTQSVSKRLSGDREGSSSGHLL